MTALSQDNLQRLAAELGVPLESAAKTSAASAAPPAGHAHCTDPECPSNIPFVVSGALIFWPRPQPTAGGRHCAHCGEVMSSVCGACGAPAGAGACCRACGSPFVPPPAAVRADLEAWAESRRRQIAEWRALL